MQHLMAVGFGGMAGAIARHTLVGLMHRRFPGFLPAGTLLVNVIGCLVIGVLMALIAEQVLFSENEHARLLLVTGFLGSLTTFSALGYETVELISEDELRKAFWSVAANLCLGFLAVWIGRLLVKAFSH